MLHIEGLDASYRDVQGHRVHAVRDVCFSVPEGKLFTLLGPSGCGKTTTLRAIAGLERPDGGTIVADGITVFSVASGVFVAPSQRHFGMVFQSYAIWPHMTVFGNAACEQAPAWDPSKACQINGLPRRSASDPAPNNTLAHRWTAAPVSRS